MQVAHAAFRQREDRCQFIAERFAPHLKGKALDVGCDRAYLKQLVPFDSYLGIDIGGTPDLVINLEKEPRLPFDDRAFEITICCEVLEHLDNLHQIFGELLRVTRGRVLASLPNNWANARKPIARGRGAIGHYGLPVDPPVDRHKWFFSLEEAHHFFQHRAAAAGWRACETVAVLKSRNPLLSALRRARYPRQLSYLNRYAHTLFVLLEPK